MKIPPRGTSKDDLAPARAPGFFQAREPGRIPDVCRRTTGCVLEPAVNAMKGPNVHAVASTALRRFREEARHLADPRTVRALCPALLAIILLPWIKVQVSREFLGTLFRDSAMSQYTGWCIRHGIRLYRDVGAPDGPVIHLLHAAMQAFVGTSEPRAAASRGHGRPTSSAPPPRGTGARAAVRPPPGWRESSSEARGRCSASRSGSPGTCPRAGPPAHGAARSVRYALFGYLSLVLLYASADQERAFQARRMAFCRRIPRRHSGCSPGTPASSYPAGHGGARPARGRRAAGASSAGDRGPGRDPGGGNRRRQHPRRRDDRGQPVWLLLLVPQVPEFEEVTGSSGGSTASSC